MKKSFTQNRNYKWLLLFSGIVVAICIAAIWYRYNMIPSWACWKEKRFEIPVDKVNLPDSKTKEADIASETVLCKAVLKDKALTVYRDDGSICFENEDKVLVQDATFADIDRDGDKEMILLLWKRGRFGEHRPFWIDSDEKTYSQHIFIYDIDEGGTVRNKWFASDIGAYVSRMKLMDKDSALIMTETREGECLLWAWESFGLKNLDDEVTFIAYGDNIIHSGIIEYANTYENGRYDFLYRPFADEIRKADIAAIGAETVLVDKASAVGGYPSFGSPIAVGEAIRDAGFDVAACANNHALDRGIYGIDVTSSFYRGCNIACLGIQSSGDKNYRPFDIITGKGIRFALFSYTYGTNAGDISERYPAAVHYLPRTDSERSAFVEEIKSARAEADFVVVFVHWGDEYSTAITDEQRSVTELLSEGGADVVIGSHPHVVQDMQMLTRADGGQMLVYYSLGNFRADQKDIKNGADTGRGGRAVFTVEHSFDGARLKSWELGFVDSYWKSR